VFERSCYRRPSVILIAAGAFKHSLTAAAACEAIARGLRASPLELPLVEFPIADGGNGTLDAYLRQGGEPISAEVRGPLGKSVDAAFGILPDGETAVIEMALASGLELIAKPDALAATTYGTGELIRAALDRGVKRIIIGLGGSATTDGGAGCLQALGLRLLDQRGTEISFGGGGLDQLASIDASQLDSRLDETEIIVAADVDNPAVGPNGAAAIFGPQKGASPADIDRLDAALKHWFILSREVTGLDVLHLPGGGAAGALAAGLMAYANAQIKSGVDLLLDYANFNRVLAAAALVITGEGKLDMQSLSGKGPIGVAKRAQAQGIPVIALAGTVDAEADMLQAAGINAAWPIVDHIMLLDEALHNGTSLLERAAFRLGCTLAVQL
jgi:glycerate kinase